MVISKQVQAIDLYRVLMFEARQRIDAINFILAGGTRLAEGIIHELCYLQLRMLCENIALGCLVAHGDIVESQIKNFEKEWSAERIIEKLEKLNPHFFPQQMVIGTKDGNPSIAANTNPNALKKDELPKLYALCGGFLHRGTLKTISRSNQLHHGRLNVPDIVNWAQKIEDLLGSHIVPLWATENTGAMILCVLRDAAQNMETTVKRLEMQQVKCIVAPSGEG
jgi:hypothetical protein